MNFPFALGEVVRVVAYLIDEVTTDLVCFDIEYVRDGRRQTLTVHEEQPGFRAIVQELETLPGFKADWHGKVCFPPFNRHRTLLFECSGAPRRS